MADVAVENKETPVVEEVDVAIAKKVEAIATENGIAEIADAAGDGAKETKENGSSVVADAAAIAPEISPVVGAKVAEAAAVDSEMKDKTDSAAAAVTTVKEAKDDSAKVASSDDVVDVAAAADGKTEVTSGSEAVAAAVAEKSNGGGKVTEATEETNGDSSTDAPAEAVKRKIASDVDAKLDDAAATTAEKKAKLEEAKEDVTNGGSDPTEVAA